jgi:hypothetical protein
VAASEAHLVRAGTTGGVRRIDKGTFSFLKANLDLRVPMVQASLLMDGGPSAALHSKLEECLRNSPEQNLRVVQKFEAWVNAQAEQ